MFEGREGVMRSAYVVFLLIGLVCNLEKRFIGGSLELPMWLTDGFLVTF